MSPRFTPRALGAVVTAAALATGLAPAASAQHTEAWRASFVPGHGVELAPGQTITPDQPAFWMIGDRVRLLSPHGSSRPLFCTNDRGHPYGRCWQLDPDGGLVELRHNSVVNDVWHSLFTQTGSTTSAYTGLYDLARRMGWMTTSGGVVVPPHSGGSLAGTYSTTMPLSPHGSSPVWDVWVHPGYVPGS
ncbi:hypothetical protein [Dietzia natronolimnaea]|uniref:hypothetical protein n=1 Tax=Dietzia natronolimnaea TaxID=161920 RepID=UPI0015FAD1BE|nr:hypothetical protein [Dietzia natronolimnaea]MBB1037428.1 hypothetical protein [Dietzia natronolimnaea]